MVPRGEMSVLKNMVTREWGLVAGGRCVPSSLSLLLSVPSLMLHEVPADLCRSHAASRRSSTRAASRRRARAARATPSCGAARTSASRASSGASSSLSPFRRARRGGADELVLQGPGLHPRVQEGALRRGVDRAHRQQEEVRPRPSPLLDGLSLTSIVALARRQKRWRKKKLAFEYPYQEAAR